MRRTRAIFGLLALGLGLPAFAQQPDPPLERGFQADGTYQLYDIDHVDMFRSSLAIVLPISPSYSVGGGFSYQLKLGYHSDVWDIHKEDLCPLDPEPCPVDVAQPSTQGNTGLGFALHMGRLLDPDDILLNEYGFWTYVAPDGATHQLHETLHDGETVYSATRYSRDGAYFRMQYASGYRIVEAPDGVRSWFEQYDPTNHRWRLLRIEDRFNNSLSVAYDTDGEGRARWTLTDTVGRTHYVLFDAQHKQVVSVDLAAFGGERAVWTFTYAFPQVHRSCLDLNPETSEYLNVPPVTPGAPNTAPFLVEITQPDGSTFKMKEGTAPNEVPTYFLNCVDGGSAAPGVLRRLYLPPGGGIQWGFRDHEYIWEEPFRCSPNFICPRPNVLRWAGVATRSELDAAGNVLTGTTWSYDNAVNESYSPSTDYPSHELNPGSRPEERRMVVTPPDNNSTVYYFRAYPGENAFVPFDSRRDYTLPYTRRVADPLGEGRFLSVQHFSGGVTFAGDGTAQGTVLRTIYRAYHLDEYVSGPVGYRHANRHVLSERTVYEDATWAKATSSGFTGLGQFRTVTTAGNFGAGDVRTTFTNYNPQVGNYPATPRPAYWWRPGSNWVLNTYDDATQTEGGVTAKQEYCFEEDGYGYASTGYLLRARTLKAGTVSGANDLLSVFTRDAAGNTTREQYYGGDTQAFSLSSLCTSAPPPSDVYRIDHTYHYGSVETSRYVNSYAFDIKHRVMT